MAKPKRSKTELNRPAAGRNAALDSLRGLAILLMIVDHIAAFWLMQGIQWNSVRLATRLALPLFAVIFGYLLGALGERHAERGGYTAFSFIFGCLLGSPRPSDDPSAVLRRRGKRLLQIAAAAVAVNIIFFPSIAHMSGHGQLDILASLLVCYLGYLVFGDQLAWAAVVILLYALDPSRPWLDYPLSIAAPLVALGILLRRRGAQTTLVAALLLALASMVTVPTTDMYVILAALPAVVLVALAIESPSLQVAGLAWIGRRPLTLYTLQYYVVIGVWYLWLAQ